MPRTRIAVAASLVLAVAAPVAFMVARDLTRDAAPRTPDERGSAPQATPERAVAPPPRVDTPQAAEVSVATPPATVVTVAPSVPVATPARPERPPTTADTEMARVDTPTAATPTQAPSGIAQPRTGSSQNKEKAPNAPQAAGSVAAPPSPAGQSFRSSGGTRGLDGANPTAPPAPHGRPRLAEAGPTTRAMQLAPQPEARLEQAEPVGRDRFEGTAVNGFKVVRETPVSTFSIDVDTASYSFMRASLARNALPPAASVRTEELVNYFPYAYEGPATAAEPFRTHLAVYPSPWSEGRKIIRIGIKGYALTPETRPRANLVFLVDTSGSMNAPNRLPLVKQSLALLVGQLGPDDRVAIVTYAGQAGTALEPTADKGRILAAIEALSAGGGTAGGEGIRQAYGLAARNFDAGGVNRVVLATDGDFNVGITDREELKGFVERERGRGIFLSVLGFGMGNYNDALMQALAQNGNGAAAYIDTINEARKVLVEEATSTLFPIAKDVKIQVEFNPEAVSEYRLIGYETRLLARQDFANDKVDAGEVGSGQSVTALYEIVPVGGPLSQGELRYGSAAPAPAGAVETKAGEYAFVQLRYKLPGRDVSELRTMPVARAGEAARFEDAPAEARFATAVAGFGEILRGGRHTGALAFDDVIRLAAASRGDDPFGYRSEFIQLVRAAKTAGGLPATRR